MPIKALGRLTRRKFMTLLLSGLGVLALGGLEWKYRLFRKQKWHVKGSLLGPSMQTGHRVREGSFPEPQETLEVETVIVGGGMAGLSAAWWLLKNGYNKFILLEMEPRVGGNSVSGENAVTAYPWGAHYVPLPGEEARYVKQLFEELGVIEGYDENGLPVYNEYYLCAAPHERLWFQGRWRDGLIPSEGIPDNDFGQIQAFLNAMEYYKRVTGKDGRKAFAIPVDLSSTDPEFLELDQLSFTEYLNRKGWDSRYLRWYVDYCCRDDYGMGAGRISAWAGIHYFASRRGRAANADPETVLTWPEGNGWIVRQLKNKIQKYIRNHSLVYSLENEGKNVETLMFDSRRNRSVRLVSRQAIFCGPRFVASKVVGRLKNNPPEYLDRLHYSPWMVANITVNSLPGGGSGRPLSWDNVNFYSNSLGYIVATHQHLKTFPKKTVLTYYQPLDEADPAESRKRAIEKTHGEWAAAIVADLEKTHPGIRKDIDRIDVWVWGHGMIAPTPGFVWGTDRRAMLTQEGNIHFAHSDMSGISLFEEAQYRGVRAAEAILNTHTRKAGI